MPTPSATARLARRAFVVTATFAVVVLLAAPVSAATTSTVDADTELRSAALLNGERTARGLAPLATHPELVSLARAHSQAMAADADAGGTCGDGATLRHRSPLSTGITADWSMLRENVACGYGSSGTAEKLHDGLMNSPGHRANILAGDVNQVGVGAYRDARGGLWLTQILMYSTDVVSPVGGAAVSVGIDASRATFEADQAALAVVSRSDVFADSLGGAALAGGAGPVLFTPPPSAQDLLDARTRAELDRVLPDGGTVYLLGGPVAIGSAVENELRAAGYRVVRLAGADRYETAIAVAGEVVAREGEPDRVLVAYGRNWPDAVTGGAAAARHGLPVVLTRTDELPEATRRFLDRHRGAQRLVLGGGAVVSDSLVRSLGATRVAGASRNETALRIADVVFGTADGEVVVIDGWDGDAWSRALAWSSYAARRGAPQVLVNDTVPGSVADWLTDLGAVDVTFVPGVDEVARRQVQALEL